MIRPVAAAAFLVVLLAHAASSVASAQTRPATPDIDSYVNAALAQWKAPGVAIAVVKDDSVVFAKGYGVRTVGRQEKVDEHTLFAIGSITKSFTATALGILVEEGMIDWDDPVVKHLPAFRLGDAHTTSQVTVRDLLSHRTGFDRAEPLVYGSPFSSEEITRRVRFQKPAWPFRSRFGYNNAMYVVAGEVLKAKTGKHWSDFIRERLLAPLDMRRTNSSMKALAASENVATPHALKTDTVHTIAWRSVDNAAPAGAINSSVSEMTRYVRMQLSQGSLGAKQIVSMRTSGELQRPQMVVRDDEGGAIVAPESNLVSYGLGWFIADYQARKLVMHSGVVDGMVAQVILVPDEALGVVVLTNLGNTMLPAALSYHLIDSYLGIPHKDWSRRMLAMQRAGAARLAMTSAHGRRDSTKPPSLTLDRYTGAYADSLFGEARIVLADGALSFRYSEVFSGRLEHWRNDTFRVQWDGPGIRDSFITFGLDADSRVSTITVSDFGTFTSTRTARKMTGSTKRL